MKKILLTILMVFSIFTTSNIFAEKNTYNNFDITYQQGESFDMMAQKEDRGVFYLKGFGSDNIAGASLVVEMPFNPEERLKYSENSFGYHFGAVYSLVPDKMGDFGHEKYPVTKIKDTNFATPFSSRVWAGLGYYSKPFSVKAGLMWVSRTTGKGTQVPDNFEDIGDENYIAPYILLGGELSPLIKPIIQVSFGKKLSELGFMMNKLQVKINESVEIAPYFNIIKDPLRESDFTFNQYGIEGEIRLSEPDENRKEFSGKARSKYFMRFDVENTYLTEDYGFFSSFKEGENLVIKATFFFNYLWGIQVLSDMRFNKPGIGIYWDADVFKFNITLNDIEKYSVIQRKTKFRIQFKMGISY